MREATELSCFFEAVREDSRITAVHISLFMAVFQCWCRQEYANPVSVSSRELMRLAKISGLATYHRTIKELHEYGYIKYVPSYNHFLGSLFYLLKGEEEGKQ